MKTGSNSARRQASILILGVGSFAHSTAQILKDDGAEVATYLTRGLRPFRAVAGRHDLDRRTVSQSVPPFAGANV